MKRFSPQSIFAAIAAFLAVLFLAESGVGPHTLDKESDDKK
ncbi:MAG: hypothetical protein RLZZ480_220 [Candidatus Parcubacteria bacterium]|jgi:hypothetical protein